MANTKEFRSQLTLECAYLSQICHPIDNSVDSSTPQPLLTETGNEFFQGGEYEVVWGRLV